MFGVDDLALAAALAKTTAASAGAAGAASAAAPTMAALAPEAAAAATGATAAPAILPASQGAPSGFASILNPMGMGQASGSFTPTVGAAGEAGAGVQVPDGSMLNGVPLQGGMSIPQAGTTINGTAAGGNMSLGTGNQVFTQGAVSDAAAGVAPGAKTAAALKPEQVQSLSRLMNNQDQQQRPVAAGGGGGAAAPRYTPSNAMLSAPGIATNRPSLGAILGMK